jgi:maltooligosyltrehalose trehalohydrolase
MISKTGRRFPVGAEIVGDATHFRVWATQHGSVEVMIGTKRHALDDEGNGYFSTQMNGVGAGGRYGFWLDGEGPFADPASRYQPDGPHGLSEIVDPAAFHWTDAQWDGVEIPGQILYEMHIGTYTAAGTWHAAAAELAKLKELGVTTVELMPVAEFAGSFGWGYDGVDLFAPTHLYGAPDDFRAFVDRAHSLGLGVILDVVYNHLGPDGNYLHKFSDAYFTDRYKCEWGEAINFDGADAQGARDLFTSNAAYWIAEYHLDGLRLDATQQIFDASANHILADITRAVRSAAPGRNTIVVAENEPQDVCLLRGYAAGGYGLDALWNDDYHHSARVAATGRREGYYYNYNGAPQEFVSAAKHGFLYQGQYYPWQQKNRGTPSLEIERYRFIVYIQNHDQVANSATGARLHQLTSPGRYRAITSAFLLMPGTPMLFQGQEFAASTPFLYFADHKPELAAAVKRGRFSFLQQFPSLATEDVQSTLADPAAQDTFRRCQLDLSERERHQAVWRMHRALIRLRAEIGLGATELLEIDGAVIGRAAFILRYGGSNGNSWLLVVNLGSDLPLDAAPEPLLAPPASAKWEMRFCSEDIGYGGQGAVDPQSSTGWHIAAEMAAVFRAISG